MTTFILTGKKDVIGEGKKLIIYYFILQLEWNGMDM